MPQVGNKHYPYTREGMAAAAAARRMQAGGMTDRIAGLSNPRPPLLGGPRRNPVLDLALEKIRSEFPGINRQQALRIYHKRRGTPIDGSVPDATTGGQYFNPVPMPGSSRWQRLKHLPPAHAKNPPPVPPRRPVGMQEGGDSAYELRIAELMNASHPITGQPGGWVTREMAEDTLRRGLENGWDFDGDGIVSAAEQTRGQQGETTLDPNRPSSNVANLFASGPYEARIEELMQEHKGWDRADAERWQTGALNNNWDINNDGSVSRSEYYKMMGIKDPNAAYVNQQRVRSPYEDRIFELVNNQGMTRETAEANQANAIAHGWDLNGDGVVTELEFQQGMTNTAMTQAELDAAEAERLARETDPDPTTADPTTADPTTADPTTADPTTADPTTADPTTADPTIVGTAGPGITVDPTQQSGIAQLLALLQQLQAARQQTQTNPFATQQGYNPYQQYWNLQRPQQPQFGQPYMSQSPFLPYAGMANPMSPSIFGGYGYGYGPSQSMAPLSYYGGFSAIPTSAQAGTAGTAGTGAQAGTTGTGAQTGTAGAGTTTAGTTGTGTTAGASGAQTNANAAQSYLANLFAANRGNQFGGSWPQMPQMPWNPNGVYMMP